MNNLIFNDLVKEIEVIIEEFRKGEGGMIKNIAVIAEPYAGKTTILDRIEKAYPKETSRINLSLKTIFRPRTYDKSKIILMDDCHYLYSRRIGGFDNLEAFLEELDNDSTLFITSWNIFSWDYLSGVLDIERFFKSKFILPRIKMDDIKRILSPQNAEEGIEYINDIKQSANSKNINIKLLKKEIKIPLLSIGNLKALFSKKEEKIEDIFFQKLENASNGNIGVAKTLWKKSLQNSRVKLSSIDQFEREMKLTEDESYTLADIISKKTMKTNELANPILRRLSREGLIDISDTVCTIKPEALAQSVRYLKKEAVI